MDEDETFGAGRAPPSLPAARGWTIGPLFQSFKSKMASFVMSPVKLFKQNDAPPSSVPPDSPTQLEPDPVLHSEHSNCQETFILHSQLEEMDGKVDECSNADKEPGLRQSQGQDEESAGGVCKILDFPEEQNYTRLLTMTEKERNNNTTVPVVHVPVHRLLLTSSFEKSPASTQCSSSSSLSNTSASCGSKLNPNIEMEEQMGLTVTQQRPLRRKHVDHNKSKSKSSSSGVLSSEISYNCTTASCSSGTDLSPCSEKSEPYYTPPASLCGDGGVPESNGLLVCSSRPSIRKRSRKALTVNHTALKEVVSSEALQKQLVESKGNQDIEVSTRGKSSKATSLLVVERNSEKSKQGLKRGEKLGEGEEKGSVINAGLESGTLPLEYKGPMEPVGSSMAHKRPTGSDCSAIMETESVQEPVDASVPVMGYLENKGSGRKGRGRQTTVKATSGAMGPGDRVTVNQRTGSLFEGNDWRDIEKKSKIGDGKDPEDCFSSTKRVRKNNDACYKPSEFDSNPIGDMELETTMTSVVNEGPEEQVCRGVVQHLDTRGLPKTSKTKKKGAPKQKEGRNRQKTLVGNERSMPSGPCPKRSVELNKQVDEAEMFSKKEKIVDELMEEEHGECTGEFSTSVMKASLEEQVPGGLVQHLDTKGLPRTSRKKKKNTEGPSQNRRKSLRFVQPDSSLVRDGGNMTLSFGAHVEQSVESNEHEFNQEKVFSNNGQKKIVDELMEEEHGEDCTGVFGTSVVKASLEEQVPGGLVQHFDATVLPRTSKIETKRALKRKVDVRPSQNRRKTPRSMQPDPSLVEDEGSMLLPSAAHSEHSVELKVDELNQGEMFSNYGQNLIVEEAMEKHGRACAGVFGCNETSRKKPRKAESTKKRRKTLGRVKERKAEEEKPDDHTLTGHLQRSYSCPEMPSLHHFNSPWITPLRSTLPGRDLSSRRRHSSFHPPAAHPPKSFRRARRHTVCSVEVEREIAPSCLWKEVYPTRRPSPYRGEANHLSPSVGLSPSSFLAQVSCFLSSPLAFLSKKIDKGGAAATSRAGNYITATPSPGVLPSSSSPSCSSLEHPFPRCEPCSVQLLSLTSLCSPLSHIALEGENETRPQSEDNGKDASCSWRQESMVMTEEKVSSDSELKMDSSKNEERGKVSSIRIRRAVPKAQTNLTPMGLPRVVRENKKKFSLEEIYTNKNFIKPPESRLQTIFEVPRNRRDGSQSLTGLSRMKRYLVFPEVGEARKPRKPLPGVGKAGNAASSGRSRRGVHPTSEHATAALSSEQLDALLCSKLEQLACWEALEEETS